MVHLSATRPITSLTSPSTRGSAATPVSADASWSLRSQRAHTSGQVLELAPPAVATDLMLGHAQNPRSMPLAEYTAEVIGLIERQNTPHGEILVERVTPLRFAEVNGY
jgi:uncharacterized oxidoreductase